MRLSTRPRRRLRNLFLRRLEDRTTPATIAWDGGLTGEGTDWLDPVNWDGDVLPGAMDDVTIGSTGSNPGILLGGTTEVKSVVSGRAISVGGSLKIGGASSSFDALTLSGTLTTGANVSVTGLFNYPSGTLEGVANAGKLTASGGAAIGVSNHELKGGFDLELPSGPSHTWSGGMMTLLSGSILHNSGSLAVSSASNVILDSDNLPSRFINDGTMTVNIPGTFVVYANTENNGTIHLQTGSAQFGHPGGSSQMLSATGSLLGDAGTMIDCLQMISAAGSKIDVDQFTGNGLINGYFKANKTSAGSVTMTGQVAKLGPLSVGNLLDVSAATLDPGVTTLPSLSVSGTFKSGADWTVTGLFNYPGGTLEGVGSAGKLTASGGASIGVDNHDLKGGFELELPAGPSHTWTGGMITLYSDSILHNAGSLAVSSGANVLLDSDNLPSRFINDGTMTVNIPGTFVVYANTENNGTIHLQTGSAQFGHPGGSSQMLNATGSLLGDAGTVIGCHQMTSAAGSKIDVDQFTGNGLINGYFKANKTTAGSVTMTGQVAKLGPLSVGNLLDVSAATLDPGVTTLPSLTLIGTLKSGADWTVTGLFNYPGGTLEGVGSAGKLTASGGASIGVDNHDLKGGFELELPAGPSHTWTGGMITLYSDSILHNVGSLAISSGSNVILDSDVLPSRFINDGTVTVNVPGTFVVYANTENNGTIHMQTGSAQFGHPGGSSQMLNATGSLLGDAGTVIGCHQMTSAAGSKIDVDQFTGNGLINGYFKANKTTAGSVTMTGQVAKLGPLSVSNFLDLSAATLDPGVTTLPSLSLSGTFKSGADWTVTGLFNYPGGTLEGVGGVGKLTSSGGASIGVDNHDLKGGFELELPSGPSHTWSGGMMTLLSGSILHNSGSLAVSSASNVILDSDNLPSRFINDGTMTVNIPGTFVVYANTENNGTIHLQTGSAQFGHPGGSSQMLNATGSLLGDAGTVIECLQMVAAAGSNIDGDSLVFASVVLEGNTKANSIVASSITSHGTASIQSMGSFTETGPLHLGLNGTSASNKYDRIVVGGTTSIGGVALSLEIGPTFTSALGEVYTLIDGSGSPVGPFAGLSEGSKVTAGGNEFTISYVGGDVRLTVVKVASVWDGGPTGNGTDWLDPVNWAGDVLPSPDHHAIIGSTGSNPGISLGGTTAVGSVQSTREVNISGTFGLLQVQSVSQFDAPLSVINGATLTGAGDVTVNGTFNGNNGTVGGGGVLYLNGPSGLDYGFTINRSVVNAGNLVLYPYGGVDFAPAATFTNTATGIVDFYYNSGYFGSGSGAFINHGLLTSSQTNAGGGPVTINMAFDNRASGRIHWRFGSLTLSQGTVADGTPGVTTFKSDPGTVLRFGGTTTFSASTSVVASSVAFTNGTADVAGPFLTSTMTSLSNAQADFNASVNLSSGGLELENNSTANFDAPLTVSGLSVRQSTLNVSGDVTVNGTFNGNNGTVGGGGVLYLNGPSGLDYGFTINRSVVNAGNLVLYPYGGVDFAPAATFTNTATGIVDFYYNSGYFGSGSGAFINHGLLTSSQTNAGGGPVTINMAFDNRASGRIHWRFGSLTLSQGTVADGTPGVTTFKSDPGTVLRFGGTTTFSASTSVVASSVAFTNGTADVAGPFLTSTMTSLSNAQADFNASVNLSSGGLELENNSTANFDAPLTVSGLSVRQSTLNVSGDVTVNGTFNGNNGTVGGGGVLYLNGPSGLDYGFTINRSVVNAGNLVLYPYGGVDFAPAATFTNTATGIVDFYYNSGYFGSGSGAFINHGLLTSSQTNAGGGPVTINMAFDNRASGRIHWRFGSLTLSQGTVADGTPGVTTISGDAGTSLVFAGQTTLNASASIYGYNLAFGGPFTAAAGAQVACASISFNVPTSLGIAGTTPAQYVQVVATGDATIGGALSLTSPAMFFAPTGTVFRIVDNQGPNPTGGTFAGLPENSLIPLGDNLLRINYAAGDGNDVTLTVVPPRVASVVINAAAVQRSRVTSLTVTFTEPVNFPMNPADAFQLKRQGNDATVTLNAMATTANSVTFEFNGGAIENGSLVDGKYTLIIDSSMVASMHGPLDGDGDSLPGGNYSLVGTPANGLFRLFGDGNGDGKVDSADFILFRAAFNTSLGNPSYNSAFDSNGDNKIDSSDFIAFRQRFNTSV